MKVKSFLNFSQDTSYKFELVEGEDIRKWYPCDNKKSLDILCENSEHCKLLILRNNDKLIAYALVWFDLIRPQGSTYMDTIHNLLEELGDDFFIFGDPIKNYFENYAKENDWLYGFPVQPHMFMGGNCTVRLKTKGYEFYPKLDKLRYYTPETGRLSTEVGVDKIAGITKYDLNK